MMLAASFHKWYESHQRNTVLNTPTARYHPPVIDEDERKYMAFLLEESYELQKPVIVIYAGKYSPLQFYGRIETIHPYEEWFIMANGEWKKKITFHQLIEVDSL